MLRETSDDPTIGESFDVTPALHHSSTSASLHPGDVAPAGAPSFVDPPGTTTAEDILNTDAGFHVAFSDSTLNVTNSPLLGNSNHPFTERRQLLCSFSSKHRHLPGHIANSTAEEDEIEEEDDAIADESETDDDPQDDQRRHEGEHHNRAASNGSYHQPPSKPSHTSSSTNSSLPATPAAHTFQRTLNSVAGSRKCSVNVHLGHEADLISPLTVPSPDADCMRRPSWIDTSEFTSTLPAVNASVHATASMVSHDIAIDIASCLHMNASPRRKQLPPISPSLKRQDEDKTSNLSSNLSSNLNPNLNANSSSYPISTPTNQTHRLQPSNSSSGVSSAPISRKSSSSPNHSPAGVLPLILPQSTTPVSQHLANVANPLATRFHSSQSPPAYQSARRRRKSVAAIEAIKHHDKKGSDGGNDRDSGADSSRSCRCPRARCGFVFYVSLLTSFLILASCSIICWLAFSAGSDLVASMAHEVRGALFNDIQHQATRFFADGLSSLQALHYDAPVNFQNITELDGKIQLLTHIQLSGVLNPTLIGLGFMNQYDVTVASYKRFLNTTNFSASEGVSIYIGDYSRNDTYSLRAYHPTMIRRHIPNNRNQIEPPILSLTTDLRPDDTLVDFAQYLGDPYQILYTPDPTATLNATVYSNRLRARGILRAWHPFAISLSLRDAVTDAIRKIPIVRAYGRLEAIETMPTPNPIDRAPLAFVDLDMRQFQAIFRKLDVGSSGVAFVFNSRGMFIISTEDTYTDPDSYRPTPLALQVLEMLHGCGLVTSRVDAAHANVTSALPTSGLNGCTRSFQWRSEKHLFQASRLDTASTGLAWSIAVVTHDFNFFDAPFANYVIRVAVTAGGAVLVAIGLVILVTRHLSKPISQIVVSMDQLIDTLAISDSAERKRQLELLHAQWNRTTVDSKKTNDSNSAPTTVPSSGETTLIAAGDNPPSTSSAILLKGYPSSDSTKPIPSHPRHTHHFTTHEVDMMERTYSSMLRTICSFDTLQAVNDAKKRFIRYIFHEVRVPFNAMVLGIEQLKSDVASHHHILPEANETLKILADQSDVVTHILNDVLSLQKIEDAAFTLDKICFNIDRMIRSTLYSFKSTCLERSLRVSIHLANINRYVHSRLKELPVWQACMGSLAEKDIKFGVYGDMVRRQSANNRRTVHD